MKRKRHGVIVKQAPYRVRRGECYVVLMRNMRRTVDNSRHGRWEPISTNGFVVVCHSRLEAAELTWFMGVRFFARPNPNMDDMAYLEWLWRNCLKLQSWNPRGNGDPGDGGEIDYGTFIRGWHPDSADLQRLLRSPSTAMVQAALQARWENR